MIGGDARAVSAARTDLPHARARDAATARHAGRDGDTRRASGYLHCGPAGAGPLREDGPQRHRVRADAGLRGGLRHPAQRGDARPAGRGSLRLRPAPRSPRSGGAAASSARGCSTSRRGARGDPRSPGTPASSQDSGEGRWTIEAAIERGGARRRARGVAVRPLPLAPGATPSPRRCCPPCATSSAATWKIRRRACDREDRQRHARAPAAEAAAGPCAMVIFGATGDLTKRKLLPALYNLSAERRCPTAFAVIGFGRKPMTDEAYREKRHARRPASSAHEPIDAAVLDRLEPRLALPVGCVRRAGHLSSAWRRADGVEGDARGRAATPSSTSPRRRLLFGPIVEQLGAAGLLTEDRTAGGASSSRSRSATTWRRRRRSTQQLAPVLAEHQIYRIDHYLGKETVQNIMAFRFANGIFEPIWNRRYVDHVQITVAETVGVEDARRLLRERRRAARHGPEPHVPAARAHRDGAADLVRRRRGARRRVKVLHAIHPLSTRRCGAARCAGSTAPAGRGEAVPAYRDEPGVSRDSTYRDLRRAEAAGRQLAVGGRAVLPAHRQAAAARDVEIVIQFRRPPIVLFRERAGRDR